MAKKNYTNKEKIARRETGCQGWRFGLEVRKGTGRNSWPIGRKTKTINGKNGKVMVIKMVKHSKVYMRNITGVCALEIVDSWMNQSGGNVP